MSDSVQPHRRQPTRLPTFILMTPISPTTVNPPLQNSLEFAWYLWHISHLCLQLSWSVEHPHPLHCLSCFPGYFLGPPFVFCHLSSDPSITFHCFGCFTLWWVHSRPSPLWCTLQYHIQPAYLAAQLLFMFKTLPYTCFTWVSDQTTPTPSLPCH